MANNSAGTKLGAASGKRILSQDLAQDLGRASAPRSRKSDCGPGGLIPPHEMFSRVLPGPRSIDVNVPFEEQVERAWERLKLGFEEPEHDRLREVLAELVKSKESGEAWS
jgi:hypothetical protein